MQRHNRLWQSLLGHCRAHEQKIRFLIAGGINTAFGLSIYPALLLIFSPLQKRYMLALLIAQAISLCFAFSSYKFGVFRSSEKIAGQFSKFVPYYLFNYALNWVGLPLLVAGLHMNPIFAQLGFAVMLAIGAYFWHSRVTFA